MKNNIGTQGNIINGRAKPKNPISLLFAHCLLRINGPLRVPFHDFSMTFPVVYDEWIRICKTKKHFIEITLTIRKYPGKKKHFRIKHKHKYLY